MDIDWSKAPEGATHWSSASGAGRLEAYWRPDGIGGYDCWAVTGSVGGERWQMNSAKLPSYAIALPAPWNGEGLPPVGTVCDFLDLRGGVKRDWCEVEVMYLSDVTLVVKPARPVDGQAELTLHPHTAEFRAIRTPEQIEAEEREVAICAMMEVCSELPCRQSCADLYDAGYRKQVAP